MGDDILLGVAVVIIIAIAIVGCFLGLSMMRWKRLARKLESEHRAVSDQLQQMNDTFTDIRAQRHDMMKHVSAIQYLLEAGQFEEAKQYMQQLISVYDAVHESIKGEQGHLASLLYPLRMQAEEMGIAVHYHLELPLSAIPLSPIDQIRLLGNLLHNALEAAMGAAEQGLDSQIKLRSSRVGGHYIVEVSNTSLPIPGNILDRLYRRSGLTTKGGNHEGLGTYTIGKLVRQYKGKLDYQWDASEFYVKIKLPIIKDART